MLIGWLLACGGRSVAPVAVDGRSLEAPATWLRAESAELGCLFERAGAEVDPRWRCGGAKTTDDVGPEFPTSLLDRLPVKVERVSLAWEHGELQAATFEIALDAGVDRATARRVFRVDDPPENVMMTDVQDCSLRSYCVLLQGFEHMGAGD